MDRNDQQAISDLFEKLADVEKRGTPRDGEAEAFIRDRIASQPGAPYYMAQTIVMQEQALNAAQARIEELERGAASRAGLFGGLFGDRQAQQPRSASPHASSPERWSGRQHQAQQGGGFLAGAAQTAMGVAGGVLLANAIGGLFSGEEAAAAEPGADDAGGDAGGGDLGGGDFGDFEL